MILVIDDDTVSRKLVASSLYRLGLKCIECVNGREGWEKLWESSDISLVITDMVMPDMDGRELVHLIRAQDELKSLPVIMLSGVLNTEEIAPIVEISPANTFFIQKPLDITLLEKHLTALGIGTLGAQASQASH
jgi:CheY-like chemotaxis protein